MCWRYAQSERRWPNLSVPGKTDGQFDGIAYRSLFATDAHYWQTITLAFDSFCAIFGGRPVQGAPVITRVHKVHLVLWTLSVFFMAY